MINLELKGFYFALFKWDSLYTDMQYLSEWVMLPYTVSSVSLKFVPFPNLFSPMFLLRLVSNYLWWILIMINLELKVFYFALFKQDSLYTDMQYLSEWVLLPYTVLSVSLTFVPFPNLFSPMFLLRLVSNYLWWILIMINLELKVFYFALFKRDSLYTDMQYEWVSAVIAVALYSI